MVEKQIHYSIFPTPELEIRVVIRTVRGEVVDFVVQLELVHHGERYRILRYDGSHGHPHCDILDAQGKTVHKHWLSGDMTLGEALRFGENDLRWNYQTYVERFLREQLR